MDARFLEGIALFNRGEFFAAHEVLEDVWREARPPEKKFLQGLIQIAVAFHHHSTGNVAGTRSLLRRGSRNLEGCPEDFGGIDLRALLDGVARWRRALENGTAPPELPRAEAK